MVSFLDSFQFKRFANSRAFTSLRQSERLSLPNRCKPRREFAAGKVLVPWNLLAIAVNRGQQSQGCRLLVRRYQRTNRGQQHGSGIVALNRRRVGNLATTIKAHDFER
jgi:hypothetical protein